MPTGKGESPGVRLAVLDDGSFVRTYAGELRPLSARFNRFVEAVARSGQFVDVRYIVPVRHLRIWEVEPPIDAVDESALEVVPTSFVSGRADYLLRLGYVVPRNWLAIDRAIAAADLLWLRLPAPNAVLALAAARRHHVPVFGWAERGALRGAAARMTRRYGPVIVADPELFASVVTTDEIEDTLKRDEPEETGRRRIVWASTDSTESAEVGRVVQAMRELEAAGRRVTLVVIGDWPIRRDIGQAFSALPSGCVENYGYVGDRPSYLNVLRTGRVLVHVAPGKGIPSVVVDAMAAGLPVVATESAGVAEILGDGERGRIVSADDPNVLARTIGGLLDDDNARATLRDAAIQWAVAHTAETQARQFVGRVRDLFPSLDW